MFQDLYQIFITTRPFHLSFVVLQTSIQLGLVHCRTENSRNRKKRREKDKSRMPVALPSDRSIQVAIHSIGSVWGIGVLLLSSLLIFILYIFLLKSGTTAFKDHSQPETHQQKKNKNRIDSIKLYKDRCVGLFLS